jgi:hypothetical protein
MMFKQKWLENNDVRVALSRVYTLHRTTKSNIHAGLDWVKQQCQSTILGGIVVLDPRP